MGPYLCKVLLKSIHAAARYNNSNVVHLPCATLYMMQHTVNLPINTGALIFLEVCKKGAFIMGVGAYWKIYGMHVLCLLEKGKSVKAVQIS